MAQQQQKIADDIRRAQLGLSPSEWMRRYIRTTSTPTTQGCWLWTGTRHSAGYGQLRVTLARNEFAHRASYVAFVGPIPEGHELHHICGNRVCCNYAHLIPVTRQQHRQLDGNAAKTHCPQGHAYTERNSYLWRGQRHCRACRKERNRRWSQRQRRGNG